MTYLVMECRQAYAIVLDESGRFLKVANLGYQVGQRVTQVVAEEPPRPQLRIIRRVAAMAACLCLVMLGLWQLLLYPVGTVRMQINPDVQMEVSRVGRVISLAGKNADGEVLIQGVAYRNRTVAAVADDLADRAMELGYLHTGGVVTIAVESNSSSWRQSTQDKLSQSLTQHLAGVAEVRTQEEDSEPVVIPVNPTQPPTEPPTEPPTQPPTQPPTEPPTQPTSGSGWDDWEDDDDDGDDDDDDDDRDGDDDREGDDDGDDDDDDDNSGDGDDDDGNDDGGNDDDDDDDDDGDGDDGDDD